jgi:hypothetical protein
VIEAGAGLGFVCSQLAPLALQKQTLQRVTFPGGQALENLEAGVVLVKDLLKVPGCSVRWLMNT